MAAVFASSRKKWLIIKCDVDSDKKIIKILTGDLCVYQIGFDKFKESGDGTKPDFDDMFIIDYGNALRLGKYEAAADAILDDAKKIYP